MMKVATIFGFFALTCVLVIGASQPSSAALSRLAFERADQSLLVKIKKNKKNDDDHDDDNHGANKNKKDDTGLSECTIQQPGGGGGCKGGFKQVCEKLKDGKKCCGCVPDKNSKATQSDNGTPDATPKCNILTGDYCNPKTTTPDATPKCNILTGDYCNP
jgi:hypothetical protein